MKKTKNRSFNKKQPYGCFIFQILVSREGLEPSTPGLKGPCSNLLSYRPRRLLYYIAVLRFWQYFLRFKGKVAWSAWGVDAGVSFVSWIAWRVSSTVATDKISTSKELISR